MQCEPFEELMQKSFQKQIIQGKGCVFVLGVGVLYCW